MNKVQLVGRTTRNIGVVSVNGNVYAKFTVAINEGKDKDGNERATFVPVTAWGKVAEGLAKYVGKGSLVGVEGRIYVNYSEEKMFMRVAATRVEYLATKKPVTEMPKISDEDIQF